MDSHHDKPDSSPDFSIHIHPWPRFSMLQCIPIQFPYRCHDHDKHTHSQDRLHLSTSRTDQTFFWALVVRGWGWISSTLKLSSLHGVNASSPPSACPNSIPVFCQNPQNCPETQKRPLHIHAISTRFLASWDVCLLSHVARDGNQRPK